MNRKNDLRTDWILNMILILLPFLMVGVVLLINGYKLNYSMLLPVWNDEIGWWKQVEAMIEYGGPLGYNGYNGTHAVLGRWGAWGWAPIVPYCLFGKIFGWKLYSMSMANMFFLSLSIACFLLLTKPDRSQKYFLILAYCCFPVTVGYSMTSMSEGLRYALGIVLIGILIWSDRKSKSLNKITWKDIFEYAVALVIIIYSIMVYMIYALVLLPFLWYMLRRVGRIPRTGICLLATGGITIVAYKLVSLFSAPYTSNTISTILKVLNEKGIYYGICYALENFFNNLATLDLPRLFKENNSLLFWFFVFYLLLMAYIAWNMIEAISGERRKGENISISDGHCYSLAFYLLLGFVGGYCMLYTGKSWTLCRGLNSGLIMAVFCLALLSSSKRRKYHCTILISWFLFACVGIWGYYQSMSDERNTIALHKESIVEETEKLQSVILLSGPDADSPWDNTIAHYGFVDYRYLALPAGYGGNYMISGTINEKAAYAVVTVGDKNQEKYEKLLTENKHAKIYEDEYFVIYRKN